MTRLTAIFSRLAWAGLVTVAQPAAAEPARSAERLAATCIPCHAPAASAKAARAPQAKKAARTWSEDFIRQRLSDYRNGRRGATVMDQIVAGYTPEELEAIARDLGARGWSTQ